MLLTLSEAHVKQGKLDDALQAAQDASAIFRALDDTWQHAAAAQYQVAYVLAMLREYKQAMDEARLGRDFFYKAEDPVGEGVAVMQAAMIQAAVGNLEEAMKTAQEGRQIFESAPDLVGREKPIQTFRSSFQTCRKSLKTHQTRN